MSPELNINNYDEVIENKESIIKPESKISTDLINDEKVNTKSKFDKFNLDLHSNNTLSSKDKLKIKHTVDWEMNSLSNEINKNNINNKKIIESSIYYYNKNAYDALLKYIKLSKSVNTLWLNSEYLATKKINNSNTEIWFWWKISNKITTWWIKLKDTKFKTSVNIKQKIDDWSVALNIFHEDWSWNEKIWWSIDLKDWNFWTTIWYEEKNNSDELLKWWVEYSSGNFNFKAWIEKALASNDIKYKAWVSYKF